MGLPDAGVPVNDRIGLNLDLYIVAHQSYHVGWNLPNGKKSFINTRTGRFHGQRTDIVHGRGPERQFIVSRKLEGKVFLIKAYGTIIDRLTAIGRFRIKYADEL